MASIFEKMNLLATQSQVENVYNLRRVLEVRHSVICLGSPSSGKTTAIQAVAQSLGNVEITKIRTKDISYSEFFGSFNSKREWEDGVFTKYLREISLQESDTKANWIVLDGPIDV